MMILPLHAYNFAGEITGALDNQDESKSFLPSEATLEKETTPPHNQPKWSPQKH